MSQTTLPARARPNEGTQQAAAPQQVAIPERPALAPTVELSGALQESGFEKEQWLVQRDGRFIQLTELLYRVAEQANGERTAEEMARGVAQATGRKVSGSQFGALTRSSCSKTRPSISVGSRS